MDIPEGLLGVRTEDIPHLFDAKTLAQVLGISVSGAKAVMRREDFQSCVIEISPRKRKVYKPRFLDWLESRVTAEKSTFREPLPPIARPVPLPSRRSG